MIIRNIYPNLHKKNPTHKFKVEMVPKLILNKLQLLDLDDHKHKFKVEMVPKCKI